jgi:hypothetical protein
MTIPELVERIEQRLAELQQEVGRLRAADEALAATSTGSAVGGPASEPRSLQRWDRQTASPATPRRGRGRASARRGSKPAAVLALARELDAGLRNRL